MFIFPKARQQFKRLARKRLESADLPQQLYHLAFLSSDSHLMTQEVAWAEGKPGAESVLLSYEADSAAFIGHVEKARTLSQRAIAAARQADEAESAAGYQSAAAIREGLFGNFVEARRQAEAALAVSNARDVESRATFALALAGAPAESLVKDLVRRFPEDTMVRFLFLPVIRAQLALNHGDPASALKELNTAAPFDLANASPEQILPFALYPCYLRGDALLASHRGKEAAVEYQKIIDHPGIVINEPIASLAYERIARAYAQKGQLDKAEASYLLFLSLWHQADAGTPIFREARLALMRLTN